MKSNFLKKFLPFKECNEYKSNVRCPKLNESSYENKFDLRILGKFPTEIGEFPHMAAIGLIDGEKMKYHCGGSLISETFVMTAAQCQRNTDSIFVRLGVTNLDQAEGKQFSIVQFIIHPNYSSKSKRNDIALIKLNQTVEFNSYIRPACLMQSLSFDGNVISTGWGGSRSIMNTLMKVELPTVSDCDDAYSIIQDSQICAGGEKGKDTCSGDGGGPIQIPHNSSSCVFDIVGITSYGSTSCGSGVPTVFTRVSFYLDWIEEIVWPLDSRERS